MQYEWDARKAQSNLRKHHIDFADAVGIFEDPQALTIEDRQATGEQRFVTVGLDFLGRILTVVYTFRGDKIRLISARRATKKELSHYEQGRI